jgi:hypothetical protein
VDESTLAGKAFNVYFRGWDISAQSQVPLPALQAGVKHREPTQRLHLRVQLELMLRKRKRNRLQKHVVINC